MASFSFGSGLDFGRMAGMFSREGVGHCIALLRGSNLQPFDGEVSFNDPEDAPKPFAPYYEAHIRPHVSGFEEQRINALHTLRKRMLITLPVAALSIIAAVGMSFAMQLTEDTAQMTFYSAAIPLLLIFGWCYMPVYRYKLAVKGDIFPLIFKFFGDHFKYRAEGLLPVSTFQPSGLLPSYEDEHTEDYIKGEYKQVTLELTEARLTKTVRSKNNRRTVTVFFGMFIMLSMNKNFSGKTIIKRDAGRFGNWVADRFNGLENVTLEDPVFEKKFEVYSTDQVEARYLLTTSFMQRLLDLSELFGGKGVQASFYDDKLLLMIPSAKNHFETASIFTPATFVEDINVVLKEMGLIFQIIDILKLDQRTGL